MRASTSASQACGIDVVELGGDDQGIDRRGPLAAAIGAAEEPASGGRGDTAQGRSAALLVRQMRPSSRKRVKASQRLSM